MARWVLLLTAIWVFRCAAQITGEIEVRVLDSSQAALADASVLVRSQETGAFRQARCDEIGSARLRQLPAGRYHIRAEAPGFAPATAEALVTTGAVTQLTLTLRVETARETMVVAAMASPLSAAGAQLQTSAASAKVAGLPVGTVRGPLALGGGSILSLAALAPGVTAELPKSNTLNPGTFSANGNRGRANNITLDNATATDVVTAGAMGLQTIPIDAVKEFTLITTNPNAEYGRNSGAQVQIITKNGTNEIHGSVFDFFRNGTLNARDYFDRTGRSTPINSHDFGATVGGPLRRNRVFFFGHYQRILTRGSSGTVVANVPRPEQVSGAIDPTAAQLLHQLRVPIAPGGTVSNPSPQTADFHGFSARVDANLSARDFFFVRYGFADYLFRSPTTTFLGSNLPTRGSAVANRPQNATIAWTRAIGPAMVNQFLASFGRSIPTFPPLFDLGGPSLNFNDGTAAFGWAASLNNLRLQNTFQYLDTLTWNSGPHAWKFGGDVSRVQSNTYNDSNLRGTFTFVSLADFLAGRPDTYTQRFGNPYRGMRAWNPAFYAQDDYRVMRHVTVNLGVRLEIAGAVTEVNDLLSNLNLDRPAPVGGAGAGALGSFDVGGSVARTNWNWAPRIGVAWNPGGGSTIRAGYGIAYDFLFLSSSSTLLRFLPPFMYQPSLTRELITGSNSFARLVAGDSDFQREGRSSVGGFPANVRNFGAFTAVDRALRNPQVHQWSLTLERHLSWGFAGRASYIGTKSNFLQRTRPINLLPAGVLPLPRSVAEETALLPVLRQVNANLTTPLGVPSNRMDPRFNAVSVVESSANSNYHSLQLYLVRRFARGYAFSAAYTFSKSIDDVSDGVGGFSNDSPAQQNPLDNRNNRAVSAFDVPHRLAITHRFEPPWFTGVRPPILRTLLAGWLFEGSFQAQSGLPATLLAGQRLGIPDPLLTGGNGAGRPDAAGPVRLVFDADPGSTARNPSKAAGSGLTAPLIGHFGTLGRNTLRINPMIQADWTAGKRFALGEKMRLECRFQIYNVFNNTTFSNPGRILAIPATFGYYQNTDSDARNVQVVMRLIW